MSGLVKHLWWRFFAKIGSPFAPKGIKHDPLQLKSCLEPYRLSLSWKLFIWRYQVSMETADIKIYRIIDQESIFWYISKAPEMADNNKVAIGWHFQMHFLIQMTVKSNLFMVQLVMRALLQVLEMKKERILNFL